MKSMRDRIPVCPHGTREDIDPSLIIALEKLERESGLALKFVSGYRCTECNNAAGGRPNSAHLRGLAIDIDAGGSGWRYLLLSFVVKMGFRRIGIGRGFIHLDLDLTLPQDVMWLY